jgi:DNA-binding transcriptional LysR family regulator
VSSATAAAVADGTADFGIVSELPVIDGLTTLPFRTDELVLILKPEHELASRGAIDFSEIAQLAFVGLHAGSSLHRLLTQAATEAGTTLSWRIQATSFDAACAMVAAGLGVSIMPRAATTAYIRSLALSVVPLTNAWAQRQLFLCSRTSGVVPSSARLLFEHLRSQS